MNAKLIVLLSGITLFFYSFCAYAGEDHLAEAIKHAEEAASISDVKAIAEHAEAAKIQATIADQHLDAGIKSLETAIEHSKMGHADIAQTAIEEAITHLQAVK